MYKPGEFEPKEIFECDDYLYARGKDVYTVAQVLRDLGASPPARLLDVGCGRGTMVRGLRSLDYAAYGVESREVVPADNVVLFREDARRTHFPNNFFDVIMDRLATEQLCALNRRSDVAADIIKETARVAKRHAYLLSTSGTLLKDLGIDRYTEGPLKGALSVPILEAIYTVYIFR